MIKKYKKMIRFFGAWQDDKEETWLREMSLKGWKLKKYTFLVYTFEKAEPKDYIYKLDYKTTFNNDMEEYLAIFNDAGWEHVEEFAGWHYFRIEAENSEVPDIYSDNKSKAEKYKGLLRFLSIILISNVVIGFTSVYNPAINYWGIGILRGFYIIMELIMIYAIVRIYRKIKKLNEDI